MRSLASSAPAPSRRGGDPVLWGLAALTFLFHLATARGYGYFRDELYYLACGEHLALGYVEHPPMVGWVAAVVRALFGDSLPALRLPAALAGAGTVWLAGATARELGGGRFARAAAALATLLLPAYVGQFGIYSMNAFDVLFWAAGWWLLARLLATGDERLWLAFGAVAGLGLLNKISLLFLGFGIAVGLLLTRRWQSFRRPWLWLGGALAALLFLPYVLWQAAHGWPLLEFMDNARRIKNVHFTPLEFLTRQAMEMVSIGGLPVVLSGLVFFFTRRGSPWRLLGWAYLAILALMIFSGGAKPYYLGPAYTVLLAGGAVALEGWTARPWGALMRSAVVVWVVLWGVAIAPFAKALLPVETYVRYAAWWGLEPEAEERHELGRLPQHFADMHGWRELAETVAEVYRSLPPAERERACIFGQNYGQAGSIDLFGPDLGLPPAISAHNSYWLWGPRDCTGEVIIVIGDHRQRLEELFESVEPGALYTCRDCMPYENDKTIWIARRLRLPVPELWRQIKHYI